MKSHPRTAYDRLAPIYDLLEAPMEWLGGAARRQRVVERAGGEVLEVGAGTGRNFGVYRNVLRLTAIDRSARMLERARSRVTQAGIEIELLSADAEQLPFRSNRFDTVVSTCVFCSVEDPIAGLREIARVVRPGGEILLLEHVRPRNPILGKLADLLTPVTRALVGPAINRRTEDNVRTAGLEIMEVRAEGVWREIVACKKWRGAIAEAIE